MSSKKKWLIYAAYLLIVAVFFLYLLFPSEAVKSYVRYQMAALAPGMDFSIAHVKPGFPPSLVFSNISIAYQNKPVASVERLTLLPDYLSLFKRGIAFRFSGKVYGGKMDGKANIATDGRSQQVKARIAFVNIRVDNVPILKSLANYQVTGAVAGNIEYSGPTNGNGSGKAEVSVSGCRVKLDPPLFGIPQVGFDLASADVDLKNQQLNLKTLTVKGPDLSGNANGKILLRDPFENSRLQLTGKITPHPSLLKNIGAFFPRKYLREGGVPFRLYGTINQVDYSFQRR